MSLWQTEAALWDAQHSLMMLNDIAKLPPGITVLAAVPPQAADENHVNRVRCGYLAG